MLYVIILVISGYQQFLCKELAGSASEKLVLDFLCKFHSSQHVLGFQLVPILLACGHCCDLYGSSFEQLDSRLYLSTTEGELEDLFSGINLCIGEMGSIMLTAERDIWVVMVSVWDWIICTMRAGMEDRQCPLYTLL